MHAAAGQPLRLRSRCGSAAPAAGIPLRSVACGEQLAEDWCLVGGVRDGGWHRGAISLRSDPTFCIALGSAAPEARPETFPKGPPPPPPPTNPIGRWCWPSARVEAQRSSGSTCTARVVSAASSTTAPNSHLDRAQGPRVRLSRSLRPCNAHSLEFLPSKHSDIIYPRAASPSLRDTASGRVRAARLGVLSAE
jgi:hypothetical protein